MAKPTSYLNWLTGNGSFSTAAQQPSSGKATQGFLAAEKPAFQFFNWLFWDIDQWIQYLDVLTTGLKGQYEVIVGGSGVAGATHATLAAALADVAVAANSRILLADSQTLTGPVQVTKNGMKITALPGVTYTAGNGSAVLQLNASRCVVDGVRFASFTTALQVQASGDYCQLRNNWFNTCTTEIDDSAATAGRKPATYGNISE